MIVDHLAATPRTKRELAELTGWPTRDVELAIQQARLAGAPICSNSDGYYVSTDPAEVRAAAERLRNRAMNQLATAAALAHAAESLERPMVLWREVAA